MTYEYIEPTSATDSTPRVVRVTREEILASYWPYWTRRMREAGKAELISAERCLEDWCAIHWATVIEEKEPHAD